MKGFLLIDKDKGMTSFDVIRDLRKVSGEKKIGHAGTLDPLATGLLILAFGEGTKLLEYFIGCDKEYQVTARFGSVSDTYDADGKISDDKSQKKIEKEVLISAVKKNFLGEIDQIPPKFSALKVNGKKACDIVRAGGDVDLKPRQVNIYDFKILDFNWPDVSFLVECGSGTYIRSLIHDLGQVLGCGAYVNALRRTKISKFCVEESVKLGVLNKNIEQGLIPLETMIVDYPFLELSDEDFDVLKHGGTLRNKKIDHSKFAMAIYKGNLVGVLENSSTGGIKFKKRIF